MAIDVINGVKLHYDITGQGDPLIFIHPPLLTGDIFAYQKEQLSDLFQIITFDIRGHGQSEPSSRRLNYALIAEDIVGLMDHLGIRYAYLCGYSTGGTVVLEAILNYPNRFLGCILIGGTPEMTDIYNKTRLWVATAISRLRGTLLLTTAISWGNADNRLTFRNLFKHAVAGDRLHQHQYFEESCRYQCTNRLHEIHAPALLIYGQKDRSFHRYAKLLNRKLAYSELFYIPNAKHQIPTKNSKELHQLIRSWYAVQRKLRKSRTMDTESQALQNAFPKEPPAHLEPEWIHMPETEISHESNQT